MKKPNNSKAARRRKQKARERENEVKTMSNMRKNNTRKPKTNPKYARMLGEIFETLRKR